MRLYLIGAGVIGRTHAAAAGRLGEDVELHVADPAPTVLAGVVMDWGPYDMSTLFDLLDPVRVEVRDAWVGRAVTAADPAGVPFDVETDAGAACGSHVGTARSFPSCSVARRARTRPRRRTPRSGARTAPCTGPRSTPTGPW
ncbi:hypothetical protein [Microbacterium timonense]|uniref:hypothetical protein n=1 Tax=Microbacterium timonense TaxID=2086576 RepID=UPI0013574500|nr:hypothetical protein [Microbacterium timonense]